MPVKLTVNIASLLIALPFFSLAQTSAKIDSLGRFLKLHQQKDSAYVNTLNRLAYEYYVDNPGKFQLAVESRQIAREIDYKEGEAEAYRQLGMVSWGQGNFSLALNHFIDGLKIAESIGAQQVIADITGNIGLVYQGLGDHLQALKFQQKSLEMQRKLKNKHRETVALNNVGHIKRAMKLYAEAIEYYTTAQKICEETNNLNGLATSILNLGKIYEEEKIFDKALDHYFRSMKIYDSRGENRGMCQSRLSIASAYLSMHAFDKAESYALESLSICRQSNFRVLLRDTYLLLSRISEAEVNPMEAFRYFKLYSQYNDSVVNSKVSSEVASYRLQYETQKKQSEINLLKKDAELQASAIRQKNTLLTSVAITLTLLAVLTIILFRDYAHQKNINKVLKTKNDEIEKQHREIAEQRDELIALNEEIRSQQEQVLASRDALEEKNNSIAAMNEKIIQINENLEKIISERTSALEKQNRQLIEYAFINAHKLRAPLARILGLANLLTLIPQNDEQRKLTDLIQDAAYELDQVTKSISQIVQEGLDAYEHKQ